MTTFQILENVKKTINTLAAPAVAVGAIWGVDIAAFVGATAAVVISVLTYVQFFCKDKE